MISVKQLASGEGAPFPPVHILQHGAVCESSTIFGRAAGDLVIPAPMPSDEEARIAAIEHYRLHGLGREKVFDHVAELAVSAFKVPISLVTIVGNDRQCFRGAHGLSLLSTPRDVSFCGHAVAAKELLVVENALKDERFFDNPLVIGEPHIRFYAGAPLRLKDGAIPGTLCLIDSQPRAMTRDEREELVRLAKLVVDVIELRLEGIVAQERHQVLARMKDEFISATSHELRTPLTSIMASLGLLQASAAAEVSERTGRLIAIAHANSTRLLALVNDILDFDKLASGQVDFELKPLDVGQTLREAVEANGGYASKHGVRLEIDDVPANASAVADHHRLLQVLANLISNAVKFSDPGGTITLRVRECAEQVRVSVMDRGRGIPEAFRERIFTRFAQAESSDSREKGGTGLGLAIVKEIVGRMNGSVSFESELGKGTTFHVDLPHSTS